MKPFYLTLGVIIITCFLSIVLLEQKAVSPNIESADAVEYSQAELAKHNDINDCWVATGGSVFDITLLFTNQASISGATICGQIEPNIDSNLKSQLINYRIGIISP